RQGPWRADLQHRRRPTAVVRRLHPRAVGEAASASATTDFASGSGPGRFVSGNGVRHYVASVVQRQGEGGSRLDAYSPVNSGARFWNMAVMPSVRSLDGRNAEFHAAT